MLEFTILFQFVFGDFTGDFTGTDVKSAVTSKELIYSPSSSVMLWIWSIKSFMFFIW